jgi:hypothetical protein
MMRFIPSLFLVVAGTASAQTTLDITVPGNSVCSYQTGAVTNGSTSGHLQATATSSSGAGCGTGSSGNVTFGPAFPLTPSATQLNSNTGSVNFSFQALNASTQCVGSITGASGGSFVGSNTLCTGSACGSVVNAVANFTNSGSSQVTYNVGVTCTGASGQATSNATVTVPNTVSTGSCPTIASTTSGITNFQQMTGSNVSVTFTGTRGVVRGNIASFDSIFTPWPGNSGEIGIFTLPNNLYVSLQFTVPSNFFDLQPPGFVGQYTIGEGTSGYSAPISMSISTTCGDFSSPTITGSTVLANCWKNNKVSDEGIVWHPDGTTGSGLCKLQEGKTYYLNFINANVSNVPPLGLGSASSTKTSHCFSGTCSDPISNGPFGVSQ